MSGDVRDNTRLSDTADESSTDTLVEVRNLTKHYMERDSLIDQLLGHEPVAVRAVDGISFDIKEGETLGLVGESGCGKSTTGETLLRLEEPTDGSVRFGGEHVFDLSGDGLKSFRRDAQIVFQDPFTSLDPRITIGETVRESLDIHDWPSTDPAVTTDAVVETSGVDPAQVSVTVDDDIDKVVDPEEGVATASVAVERVSENQTGVEDPSVESDGNVRVTVEENLDVAVSESGDDIEVSLSVSRTDKELRNERVRDLLERVGLSEDQFDRYPAEFSGGQRQRIGIARALAINPDFLVLDEPTSALDVSVQAQILNLLADLQDEFNLTYLLISHDLSVIRHICDRVAVMYLGEIVEIADADVLFSSPKHPYTKALLESVPRAETAEKEREVDTLKGDVPSPRDPPSGCRFRTRCPDVIPPDELAIDQQVYRELMHFRELVEEQEISVDKLAADAGITKEDGQFEFDRGEKERFVETIKDAVIDVDLPGRHESVVDDAIVSLAEGDWEDAAETLRSEYESVCETTTPVLTDDSQPVACHLYDEQ